MRYAKFLAEVADIVQTVSNLSKAREVERDPDAKSAVEKLAVAVGKKDTNIVAKARKLTGLSPDEAVKKVVSDMADGGKA